MSLKDKTCNLEQALERAISKLKGQISKVEFKNVWENSNSLGRLKTSEEYKRDRDHTLQLLKQINDPKLLPVQSDIFTKELEGCLTAEYTSDTLPLVLHQFYCIRVQQMVQMKHILMCRWARFAINDVKTYGTLTDEYQRCLKRVTDEYSYCLGRARDLAVVEDLFKAGKPIPSKLVDDKDVCIYLKWLVHLFHSMKKVMSFIAEIQLLPLRNQEQPDAPVFVVRSASRNQLKWRNLGNKMRKLSRSLTPGQSSSSISIGLSSTDYSSSNLDSTSNAPPIDEDDDAPPTTSLPSITLDWKEIRTQLRKLMASHPTLTAVQYLNESSSEQLKIFYLIYGEFKTVFQQQVEMSTFHVYDSPTHAHNDDDESGGQSANMAFLKASNWLDSIEIRPNLDVLQVKCYIEMSDAITDIDPLLNLCNSCIRTDNQEKALFSLKQHYQAIYATNQSSTSRYIPTAVANNKHGQDSMLLWRCIYTAVDMRNPRNKRDSRAKFTLNDEETDILDDIRGSTNMNDAMQLLNEEDGRNISAGAQNMPQNATFGFLLLRHVKIREKRIKCLWLINYMCSVERTITINTNGLSQKKGSSQNNLGITMHLFDTPADYIIDQDEFMQYSDVDNHDDYYSFHDTVTRVWDQAGKPIMYSTAKDRMEKLERELLTISSYYIQKDILNVNQRSETDKTIDMNALSQSSTDRFTILLDIWTLHSKFLDAKVKLMNLYLEAYHSVYDKTEKRKLAQVITDLIGLSIRYDTTAQYFAKAYESETSCLEAQFDVVQSILKYILQSERDYNYTVNPPQSSANIMSSTSIDALDSRVSLESDSQSTPISGTKYNTSSFGLPPLSCTKTKLISLSGDLRTEASHHLFECFNSLSAIALLPPLVQHSLQMASGLDNITGVEAIVGLNTKIWLKILDGWSQTKPLGLGLSEQAQNMIFHSNAIDKPLTMVTVAQHYAKHVMNQKEELNMEQNKLKAFCDVLQLITSHYRLLLTCHRSVLLQSVYQSQIRFLEEEEASSYLQPVKLEAAFHVSSDSLDLEGSINEAKKATLINKPGGDPTLPLAIDELFINCVDKFSFESKDDILKNLMFKERKESIMLSLEAQIAFQNSLLIVCQQCALIIRFTAPLNKNRTFGGFSNVASAAIQNSEHLNLLYLFQNAFISFQKQKTGVRNYVLSKYKSMGSSKPQISDMIDFYCKNLMKSQATYSIRHQIVILYLRLNSILANYPSTRNAFFTVGGPRSRSHSASHSEEPPLRNSKGRVKALLTNDGKSILNLFFLPHNSEIITMFTDLSIDEQTIALNLVLGIVSALYNIVSYTCAIAELGSLCSSSLSSGGGTENIGGELLYLQHQISELDDPRNPVEVINLLNLYYNSLVLSHDLAIRYFLKQTLFMNNNRESLSILNSVCITGLNKLTTNGYDHALSHPLLPVDDIYHGKAVLPWRQFLASHGSCFISAGALTDVFSLMYISVASLTPSGRRSASGEILALSLLLEDVLTTSELVKRRDSYLKTPSTISKLSQSIQFSRRHSMCSVLSKERNRQASKPLPSLPPLAMYQLINRFLTIATQVERLRHIWACNVMNVLDIRTYREAKHFDSIFQQKVMKHARKMTLKRESDAQKHQMESDPMTDDGGSTTSSTDFSVHLTSDSLDSSVGDLNEVSLHESQVFVLEQLLSQQMIEAEIKNIERLAEVFVQETQREPDTLPLDVWKKESMKGVLDASPPQFVKDLITAVQSYRRHSGVYKIPEGIMLQCVNDLSSAVLKRERDCYHLYASSYESTIQTLYHQLYIKDQEIECCRKKIKSLTSQNRENVLISSSEIIYNLLLEITGLRTKVSQLTKQLKEQESDVRKRVIKEYDKLLTELAASGITVKAKYEQYRQSLYSDTLSSLERARQNVAANLSVLKEKISSPATTVDQQKLDEIKGIDYTLIQNENTHLTNMLSQMRSVHGWKRVQQEIANEDDELELKEELNKTQQDYLELKIQTDQELSTLKLQVLELQKSLAYEEMTSTQLQKSLNKEKRKKVAAQQLNSRDKDKPTTVERMQDEKIDKLIHEIDEKDHQLKSLMATQEEEMKCINYEKKKLTKSLKQMKQTLHHERNIKLDAFHQIDEWITQVNDIEHSTTPMDGRSTPNTPGLFTLVRGTTTPSSIRSASHIINPTKPDHRSSSAQSFKLARPKMDEGAGRVGHTAPNSETSSSVNPPGRGSSGMSGAFKLI